MTYLLGVVAFVIALVLSVVLHEAGHFLTAKKFGMKATQFFAGFGPTIWSFRRGETEYGVKALPFGGFVKIVGYTPLEEIDPEDEPRAFYRQPARQRAVVIVAGVVMNALIAFLLLFILATAIGVPQASTTTRVQTVSTCVPPTAADADNGTCPTGAPKSPATLAGMRNGDIIVSVNGHNSTSWTELSADIKAVKPGETVPIVVDRHGERVALHVTMANSKTVPGSGFLGITPVSAITYDMMNPISAADYAGTSMGRMVKEIVSIVSDIPGALPKLFTSQRATTPGGQVGSIVGAAQASGQVFSSTFTWRTKIAEFISLIVSLNLFLGLLNVIPLLPLDGGHLAVVCYERIKAWLFRLRGRADPGPVDMNKLMPLTYAAVVLMVGLGVLLILADIVNPLKLPQ
jgi:membrane-associated protease RseP (regulator of RpoE activity)